MTRTCPTCGVPEERRTDAQGRVLLNLDPISGKCLKCLSASVKPKTFDPKNAQLPSGDKA